MYCVCDRSIAIMWSRNWHPILQ